MRKSTLDAMMLSLVVCCATGGLTASASCLIDGPNEKCCNLVPNFGGPDESRTCAGQPCHDIPIVNWVPHVAQTTAGYKQVDPTSCDCKFERYQCNGNGKCVWVETVSTQGVSDRVKGKADCHD